MKQNLTGDCFSLINNLKFKQVTLNIKRMSFMIHFNEDFLFAMFKKIDLIKIS